MNYQIIKDEKLLREFIEWLPDLQQDERYYVCLFARNKYCKDLVHIKSDKAQLKRFISDKERLFNKIQQLEIPVGRYLQRTTEVPERALALYITPNPRSLRKATANMLVKLAISMRDANESLFIHQEALSQIQKAKGTKHYVDFDFDFPEDKKFEESIIRGIKSQVLEFVNPEAVKLLRTRGGIHCLVNPKLVNNDKAKTFYTKLMNMGETDQSGDQMIPVPGCTQGDFIPHFINF
jgi:hypothetical protein